MCDTYIAKCKECGQDLPIHLGDWSTKRNEIECYCRLHIPPTNCRIFVPKSRVYGYPKSWKMGIRSLTENAKKNIKMNYPNINTNFTVVDI